MPAWFDVADLKEHTTGYNINNDQFRESVDRVKKVIEEEAKLLKDSKKIVIGGFSQGGIITCTAAQETE